MERLLLTLVLGFALGILLASYTFPALPVLGLFLVISAGLFALSLRAKATLLFALLCIGAAVGYGRIMLEPSSLPDSLTPLLGQEITLEGRIVASPDVRETSQRLMIETNGTRVLVVAQPYPPARFGEEIRATGTLAAPEPFATDGGREFRYDRFLAKDGVFALLERADIEVTTQREGFAHVQGALSDLKFEGLDALGQALPEPHASLAGGLILGGKQGLGEELLDDFIVAGLVHIVVLSGYNVMIVAEFVLRLLAGVPRRLASLFGILTIAAFVLAAGAGAASIRAGLMAGIAVFARATGRTYDAFRALLVAGVFMVLISPLSLAFDPGFQLSFVATLGLIFGAPLVAARLLFIRSEFLREVASATIAAQIAVLPLLLYQNGLFSLVALPANLLVLPFVPLAMFASAVAGVAGWLIPTLAPLIGLPAYALLSYIILATEAAAGLPLAAVSLDAFPFVFVVLAYVLLAFFLMRALPKDASLRRPS